MARFTSSLKHFSISLCLVLAAHAGTADEYKQLYSASIDPKHTEARAHYSKFLTTITSLRQNYDKLCVSSESAKKFQQEDQLTAGAYIDTLFDAASCQAVSILSENQFDKRSPASHCGLVDDVTALQFNGLGAFFKTCVEPYQKRIKQERMNFQKTIAGLKKP